MISRSAHRVPGVAVMYRVALSAGLAVTLAACSLGSSSLTSGFPESAQPASTASVSKSGRKVAALGGEPGTPRNVQVAALDKAPSGTYEKPQPGIPIALTTDDVLVKKALLMMQQNIDTPLSTSDLARRVGASRRQLERHFQLAVGTAPSLAYKLMRLEQAEFRLRTTAQTVTEIANATGFCDSSHFIRTFRKKFGTTPVIFRKRTL